MATIHQQHHEEGDKQLAFLRRNISSCPRNIRETSYKSLVLPQVEYASTVWDTSIKSQAAAVEAVQRRATRYIMGDYRQESSVMAMLQQLHLDSLQTRRLRARATMMYRVVNRLIAIPSAPLQPAQNITRGHTKRFIQQACTIRCYQDSFYPARISIWNALPQQLVDADSLQGSAHTATHREPCFYPVFKLSPPPHTF